MLHEFESLNPENFETWTLLGQYFQEQEDCEKALFYYNIALTKSIGWKKDRDLILKNRKDCMS